MLDAFLLRLKWFVFGIAVGWVSGYFLKGLVMQWALER